MSLKLEAWVTTRFHSGPQNLYGYDPCYLSAAVPVYRQETISWMRGVKNEIRDRAAVLKTLFLRKGKTLRLPEISQLDSPFLSKTEHPFLVIFYQVQQRNTLTKYIICFLKCTDPGRLFPTS
jgi:hypothetical protein